MNPILINPNKNTSLSKTQLTFNKLIKKIEKLQKTIQNAEVALNEGLEYYHSHVRPIEQKMVDHLSKCIPIFYTYYRHPKSTLSKNESEILKELIHSLLRRLCSHVMPQQMSPEITKIIEDIEGIDFQKALETEFQSIKENINEFATQNGINIDLSDISSADSKEELIEKLQRALFEADMKRREEELVVRETNEKIKKKTKHQLKKEQKAKELEEIQKKGLSKIYKELAKILHPDLESDLALKAEKESLMKKLTVAYENQDLHTLLALEIAWMNQVASNEEESHFQIAEEQLMIYNSILKDQAASLKEELDRIKFNPRYYDIIHILENSYQFSIFEALENEKTQLTCDIERYSSAIAELTGGSNFKRVKQILKEFSLPPIEDIISQLFDY